MARASAFNRIGDYLATANNEICLLLQIESRAGLAALDEIATVDGIFVGPSDLAADMGYLGNSGAAEVQAAVEDALNRISPPARRRAFSPPMPSWRNATSTSA